MKQTLNWTDFTESSFSLTTYWWLTLQWSLKVEKKRSKPDNSVVNNRLQSVSIGCFFFTELTMTVWTSNRLNTLLKWRQSVSAEVTCSLTEYWSAFELWCLLAEEKKMNWSQWVKVICDLHVCILMPEMLKPVLLHISATSHSTCSSWHGEWTVSRLYKVH